MTPPSDNASQRDPPPRPPAWQGSTRRESLPPNWQTLRRQILDRDGRRCTITMRDGTRCRDKATDVHHLGTRDDHRPEQLAAICSWHHKRITAQEANGARSRPTSRRPTEPHPGLIR